MEQPDAVVDEAPATAPSGGSSSPDDHSRTPDSGPDEDMGALSEVDSIKSQVNSIDVSPSDAGNLVHFVADDFMEKLKKGGLGSSSAFNLAPVDPRILQNLDQLVQKLCENVAEMNATLTGQIRQITTLTAEHVRVYRSAIEKTCDNVDSCIKTMYQLMAKTEEVHKSMYQISNIYDQIKELKRMVTILEGYVDSL